MSAKEQTITSAALYFDPERVQSIPLRFFERAREFFVEHDLSPILFTANGGEFTYDDSYLLAERGEYRAPWGDSIVAKARELIDALRNEKVKYLGLDSPRSNAGDAEEWRADVSASSLSWGIYVGIEDDLVPDPARLLRRAYEMAKDLFPVRYGIAYKMPLAQHPSSFATGRTRIYTLASFREEMRAKGDGTYKKKITADDLWSDELGGPMRHLSGLFRGAYPASIISESHLRSAALLSRGMGRLSELDDSLWLWELSDSGLPIAESMLESRHALVKQAGPAK